MDTFTTLVQLVGLPTALAVSLLILGARGEWVFGREARWLQAEIERERERGNHWRLVAERALQVAEKTA